MNSDLSGIRRAGVGILCPDPVEQLESPPVVTMEMLFTASA
jgi:hypothetical protein